MKVAGKTRLFWQRAILILGALGCLCVSDSAGPRLLPLPTSATSEATTSLSTVNFASSSPTQKGERNAHMAMTAGQQYRPRDQHHQVQPATRAPEHWLQIPLAHFQYLPSLDGIRKPKAASRSIHIGRAPPRLA